MKFLIVSCAVLLGMGMAPKVLDLKPFERKDVQAIREAANACGDDVSCVIKQTVEFERALDRYTAETSGSLRPEGQVVLKAAQADWKEDRKRFSIFVGRRGRPSMKLRVARKRWEEAKEQFKWMAKQASKYATTELTDSAPVPTPATAPAAAPVVTTAPNVPVAAAVPVVPNVSAEPVVPANPVITPSAPSVVEPAKEVVLGNSFFDLGARTAQMSISWRQLTLPVQADYGKCILRPDTRRGWDVGLTLCEAFLKRDLTKVLNAYVQAQVAKLPEARRKQALEAQAAWESGPLKKCDHGMNFPPAQDERKAAKCWYQETISRFDWLSKNLDRPAAPSRR